MFKLYATKYCQTERDPDDLCKSCSRGGSYFYNLKKYSACHCANSEEFTRSNADYFTEKISPTEVAVKNKAKVDAKH